MKSVRVALFAIAIFLGSVGNALGQTAEDLRYAPLEWKQGDARTIETTGSTRVTSHDSVLLATEVKSQMRLKVLAVLDTVYEVEFQDITVNDTVSITSEAIDTREMQAMLVKLLQDMQERMRSFKYVLIVDNRTGQAVAVKNEKEMARFMEDIVVVVLNAFFDGTKVELTVKERNDLQFQLKKLMKEQMPAAIKTVLNSFNYIFQCYSTACVPGKTHTNEIEMYYVDAIQYGDKQNKARQVVTATETADKFTLKVVMTEDQRAAYKLYVTDQGREDRIPFSKFKAVQGSMTVFDRASTWIIQHEATVEVKLGDALTVQKQVALFKR